MENMEKEFMAEQLGVFAESVRKAKEDVCGAINDIHRMGAPESVGDWFVEFCRCAEMLIGAAEREKEKIAAAEKEEE